MNIKGIMIDSNSQLVETVMVDDALTIGETTEMLNSEYIDVREYDSNNLIYFDEYGFYNTMNLFRLTSGGKWYGGKALLIQTVSDGNVSRLSDCSLDVDYIRNNITWCKVDNEEAKEALKPASNMKVYTFTKQDLDNIFDSDLDIFGELDL